MFTRPQEEAARKLAESIDLAAKLPHRVLSMGYSDIFVMDFERLLQQNTVDLLKTLIKFEQSSTAVIVRMDKTHEQADDVFVVSLATEPDAYWSFIRRNATEFAQRRAATEMRPPWLIFAEKLGACSDLGTWCIYGEKYAEIALLGFKQSPGPFFQKRLYSDFRIEKLADALRRGTFFGEPGNPSSEKQRAILSSAYLR